MISKKDVHILEKNCTMSLGGIIVNNKLSKNKLEKMITSDFTNLTIEEIKALIQREVDKGPDKLDTEYIELCFELMNVKNNEQNKKIVKYKNPAKVLLIAATFIVLLVSTLTVFAQFNINIPQKIVQLIDGNAELDYSLENADTTADVYTLLDTELAIQIKNYGIEPVTFPEEILKDNCTIVNVEEVSLNDYMKLVDVNFEYYEKKGCLSIEKTSKKLDSIGNRYINNIVAGKMLKINGMDVIVFEQDGGYSSIIYKDYLTTYEITLEDCDLNSAISLAKTIK